MFSRHLVYTKRPKVIDPLWKCIYCGSQDRNTLTREHVLPIGMGGGIILHKASCGVCREVISPFETRCMKENFGAFRHQVKLSRHAHERPLHLPLEVEKDGVVTRKMVPLEERPNILMLPEIDLPPRLMGGNPRKHSLTFKAYYQTEEAVQRAALHGGEKVYVGGFFDTESFVRSVAKIAHGMMFITFKNAFDFEPLLLGIILRNELDDVEQVFGRGEPFKLGLNPDSAGQHQLKVDVRPSLDRSRYYIIVTAMLFSMYPVPAYCVVAGRSVAPPDWCGNQEYTP